MLLMYASSLAGVAPGSQTGPLEPIDLVHPDDVPADLEATIEGWIDERGKETRLERTDEPLPAADAIDLGIASAAATSVTGFLAEVDGQTVQTPSGPITLDTRIATSEEEAEEGTVALRFDNLGPIQRVAHAISTPSMVYFLLVFGLAALAFEITQPGFGLAGFAGVGLLALAAYGLWVVPPSILGMALLLGGIGLMTLDVRLRNLGLLTAVGLIAFAAGSVLAWSRVADAIRISPWLIGGAVVASLLVLRLRAHRRPPVARSHREHAEGTDRTDRGGAGQACPRGARLREGRDVAGPRAGRPDRSRRQGAGPGRRRSRAARRGGAGGRACRRRPAGWPNPV